MPILTVEMLEITEGQRKKIAEDITKSFVETLDIPPERIIIVFHEVQKTHIAKSGKLFSDTD